MPKRIELPESSIVSAYSDKQDTLNSLARKHGVSRPLIRNVLLRHGVAIMGLAEAQRIRHRNTPPDVRRQNIAAALAAWRARAVPSPDAGTLVSEPRMVVADV